MPVHAPSSLHDAGRVSRATWNRAWRGERPTGARADDALRGAHRAVVRPPAAALPVDRRVRGLQLPRPGARDRRRALRRARAAAGRSTCTTCSAVIAPTTRARGWISGLADDGRRSASDARRAAHRQAAARARRRTSRSTSASSGIATASTSTTSPSGCTRSIRWRARPAQPLFNALGARARAARRTAPSRTRRATARRKRMYWKLSIDLSRPLVASMGQHDPLDGLVTCAQLEATARAGAAPSLRRRDRRLRRDARAATRSRPATRSASAACSSTRIASRSWSGRARPTRPASSRCSRPRASGSRTTSAQADLRLPADAPAGVPRARPRDRPRRRRARRTGASSCPADRAEPRSTGARSPRCAREIERSGCDAEHRRTEHLARAPGHQRRDAGDEPRARASSSSLSSRDRPRTRPRRRAAESSSDSRSSRCSCVRRSRSTPAPACRDSRRSTPPGSRMRRSSVRSIRHHADVAQAQPEILIVV